MRIDAPRTNQIAELRQLWQEAFGDTEDFLDIFFQTAFSLERCLCVLIENKIVAALYWFDCLYENNKIAYLYAIATAKNYRGNGICHKLMTSTHMYLKKLGYAGTILVPGKQELFHFYENMQYKTCSTIHKFSLAMKPMDTNDFSITKIDKHKYATYRQKLLPIGSVIQENEQLDFLEKQADFYYGLNANIPFLLAISKDIDTATDTLYGIEFLGNASVAPFILYSLGYKKGTFRTPGGKVPFAMYLSLNDSNLLPPLYFGLAFD